MRHDSPFVRLADLLQKSSQRPELRSKLEERRCLAMWAGAVGESIAAATRPVGMRNSTLTVVCKNSVWRNELELVKSTIMEKLNSKLRGPMVKRIRFSTAWDGTPTEADGPNIGGQSQHDAGLSKLTGGEESEIRNIVSRIDDERISTSLLSAWATKRSLDQMRKTEGWDDCPSCGALKSPDGNVCPVCKSQEE